MFREGSHLVGRFQVSPPIIHQHGRQRHDAKRARGIYGRRRQTTDRRTNDRCFQHLLSASWAAAFHEFNRDGWLDLYVANGWMPATR